MLDKYNVTNKEDWEKYKNFDTYHCKNERLFLSVNNKTIHNSILKQNNIWSQEGIVIIYV